MTILFWDIDGTLLTTGRAGVFALEGACKDVTGRAIDLQSIRSDGLTDHQLAVQILEDSGVSPDPAIVERFMRRYETLLPTCLPLRQGRVLRGVREILVHLRARRHDVHSMLLTGNTALGAKAKLAYYGLEEFFEGGAFSEDCGSRSSIALRALAMVRGFFPIEGIGPNTVYVVGDTPHDVECAKAIDARCIAIATGGYSTSELMVHAPWKVLEHLPDPIVFDSLIEPPRSV